MRVVCNAVLLDTADRTGQADRLECLVALSTAAALLAALSLAVVVAVCSADSES